MAQSIKHFYRTTQNILYRGFKIKVLPGVFVPRQISKFNGISPKNKKMYQDKNVLDMGTGTGVQSIIANESGAKSIVAVDINKKACRNCEENLKNYKVKDFKVIESDLFKNVEGKFDSIVAYLPSLDAPVENIKDMAIYDPGFQTFKRFIKEGKNYMTKDGIIYTSWVNVDDSIKVFYNEIKKYNYKILNSHLINHEGEEWWMFDLQ